MKTRCQIFLNPPYVPVLSTLNSPMQDQYNKNDLIKQKSEQLWDRSFGKKRKLKLLFGGGRRGQSVALCVYPQRAVHRRGVSERVQATGGTDETG